jgi:hypothetical protein
MTREKIREQIEASVRVNCAGAPTVKNTGLARKRCSVYEIIELATWKLQGISDDTLRTKLGPKGWMKTKSLGEWRWLCPSCHDFVIKKRKEARHTWGH